MSRFIAVFALILMLITGLVLGKLSTLGQKPVEMVVRSDNDAAETARVFYAEISGFLETGDAANLESLLAPEFVDHSAHAAGDESAGEFLHYLESLRSSFPGLRLEVSDLSARSGMVAVDVTLSGDASGSFAGLPVDAGVGKSGYEVLEVEGDQIVERWGSREIPPLYESVISVDMPTPAGTFLEPRIERLTFEPNGSGAFLDHDGFLLVAEKGVVAYQVAGSAGDRIDSEMASDRADTVAGILTEGASIELMAGQSILIPPDIRFRIMNRGSGSASVLMISIRQTQFGTGHFESNEVVESIGLERMLLAGGGMAPASAAEEVKTVAVGKIVLPAGAVISQHAVGGAELFLVMLGEIDLTVHRGTLVWNQHGERFEVVDDLQTIESGQAARASPGAVVEYRAGSDEPATLWIVTIQAESSEASSKG